MVAAGTNPLLWFSVGAVLVLLLELGRGIRIWTPVAVGAIALAIFFVLGAQSSYDSWSAYYRITAYPDASGLQRISVNGIPHQAMWPVAAKNKEPFYEQIFHWFPDRTYDNVLGDLTQGHGDASLTLFPRKVSPLGRAVFTQTTRTPESRHLTIHRLRMR